MTHGTAILMMSAFTITRCLALNWKVCTAALSLDKQALRQT